MHGAQSQKNCARYAGLFANETGSTLATTSAFKANAESMQKQYQVRVRSG